MTSKFIPPDPRQMRQPQMPDLTHATDIVCENCGNLTFQEVLLMKKVSALVSPNGKEGIVPIPTFSCVACGYVNKMFRPIKTATEEPTEQTRTEAVTETEPTRPKLVLED
jgi:ribosomal protein L37E